MLRLPRAVLLTLSAFFLLILPTHAQDTFQLLTPTTGWYLLRHHLYYTTDSGAHWSDISPVQSAKNPADQSGTVAVHFRDTKTAWAIIATESDTPPDCDDSFTFDFASTTDAGAHWSRRIIPVFDYNICPRGLSSQGEIFFIDSAHGWLNLVINSNTNFPMSLLLYTTDGGITWHETKKNDKHIQDDCSRGSFVFTTPQAGWSLSQLENQLCVTHDGGANFTEVILNPPAAGSALQPDSVYSLPTFENNLHGFEVAVHERVDPVNKKDDYALVLFETSDGGRTWHPAGTLTGLDFHVGFEALAVSHSTWIFTEKSSNPTGFVLHELSIQGSGNKNFDNRARGRKLSFADPSHGWVYADNVGLLSTNDAGATWTNITPPASLPYVLPHTDISE